MKFHISKENLEKILDQLILSIYEIKNFKESKDSNNLRENIQCFFDLSKTRSSKVHESGKCIIDCYCKPTTHLYYTTDKCCEMHLNTREDSLLECLIYLSYDCIRFLDILKILYSLDKEIYKQALMSYIEEGIR